jgi:hypothetical protein
MKFFKNATRYEGAYFGVSYDRYTDILPNLLSSSFSLDRTKIQIGLLGAVDTIRRDYDVVCGALKHLSVEERDKLCFNVLGACLEGQSNEVVRKIAQRADNNFFESMLTEETFFNLGKQCDVLISPLSNSKQYGTFNGTGSIGDTLYLRKKLLIPKFTDPLEEFKDIFLCYSDERSLAKIMRELFDKKGNIMSDEYFLKFSTENVFKRLVTDLNL